MNLPPGCGSRTQDLDQEPIRVAELGDSGGLGCLQFGAGLFQFFRGSGVIEGCGTDGKVIHSRLLARRRSQQPDTGLSHLGTICDCCCAGSRDPKPADSKIGSPAAGSGSGAAVPRANWLQEFSPVSSRRFASGSVRRSGRPPC